MTPRIQKLRAWLYSPVVQIVALMFVGSAWSSTLDRLVSAYRGGPVWSPWLVIEHVIIVALLFLFFRIADGIEARMKAGDRASKIIGPTKGTYNVSPSLTERIDMTLNGIAPKIPCTNANTDCDYPEPHHHGFACSTTCPCRKGAHRPSAARLG